MAELSPFVEANYGWPYGSSGWNDEMDGNLVKFSYLHDRNIDAIVSSLPAISDGTAYFNTTDNRLYFDANGVRYFSPTPKWFVVTMRSTGTPYQFDGTDLTTDIVDVVSSVAGRSGAVTLTSTDVGLGNVNNTSDANKPVSVAQQAALDLKTNIEDLANTVDPLKGAGLVGRVSVSIASIVDLLAAKQDASALYNVAAYYPGVYALASPSAGFGSNQFKWAPLVPRTSHNGGTIISPTVPWAGTQASVAAFLLGTGETQPAGVGCFVAINRQQINVGQFGATGVSTDDQTQSLLSAIAAAPTGGELIFPLGIFTTTQTLLITKSLNIYGLGTTVNVSLRCTTASSIPTLKVDGPDAGSIRSIGFWASLNNGPQLHVTNTAHMWHLDTLLFRSCPGSALRVDNVTWDFHWRNIDILSCALDTTLAPVDGAAVVVGGADSGVNNAHFTALRVEQARNASIYWSGSGTVTKGKCDRGFVSGVTQPSIIINAVGGNVTFTDYYIGGSAAQYEVKHQAGEVKFVSCLIDRPTTADGSVQMALTRQHSKADAVAYSFFEPRTGRLSFDACSFRGTHVSVSGVTRGVVTGSAADNVYVANDVVFSSAFNGGSNFTEVKLTTNATFPSNNYLDRSFLVNATTGAKAKITTSFSTGGIRMTGNRTADFPAASTARIEYFANDEEFVSFSGNCRFDNVQPFDIPGNTLAISSVSYSGATFLTSATLSGAVTTGYEGYFLINQTTGKRWKILSHSGSVVTLHYDVSAQLGTSDVYSVMAVGGYGVQTDGVSVNWVYANTVKTKAVSELARFSRTVADIIFNVD